MANKIRPKRSNIAGSRPLIDKSEEGNLYLNIPDQQIGFHDELGVPVDLVGVRNFSNKTAYKAQDIVAYNGKLYRALVDIPPNNFISPRWVDLTTGASTAGGGGTTGGAGTAGNMPAADTTKVGQALVVNSSGNAVWGAEMNSATQIINGGTF